MDLVVDQKKDQKNKIKSDPSISFAVELLGFQNLLFLLNTLMMEEVLLLLLLLLLLTISCLFVFFFVFYNQYLVNFDCG